jgi:hypothetical protein
LAYYGAIARLYRVVMLFGRLAVGRAREEPIFNSQPDPPTIQTKLNKFCNIGIFKQLFKNARTFMINY